MDFPKLIIFVVGCDVEMLNQHTSRLISLSDSSVVITENKQITIKNNSETWQISI